MTLEERRQALNSIETMIPGIIFKRFMIALAQVNNQQDKYALLRVLSRMCKDESHEFWYTMEKDESQDTITPIREIIDLLDGWILTATVSTGLDMTLWHVQSIKGKVRY